MNIQAVKLAFFSPTGTSKAVVQAVGRGIGHTNTELIDATRPKTRQKPLTASADDLLVVAIPVYGGRVPFVLHDWLRSIQVEQTPTVCIVLYGNREYEDALIELKDIFEERGGVPLAGAAFIGEHSFSSPAIPIAVNRPDQADLSLAEDFGRKVAKKLTALAAADQIPGLTVPGDKPYKDYQPIPPLDLIAVSEECTQCVVCAEACPVEAIPFDDGTQTDKDKCIKCCACIKVCPAEARSLKPSPLVDKAKLLSEKCAARKDPELYL